MKKAYEKLYQTISTDVKDASGWRLSLFQNNSCKEYASTACGDFEIFENKHFFKISCM